MGVVTGESREGRAGRNQSLFRTVNEQLADVNESLGELTGVFVIVCECADKGCMERIELQPADYAGVRDNPRWFVVLPGHVYPDVENVIREGATYVVVEKVGAAARIAEATEPTDGTPGRS
jgi:hypothetical protein